MIGMANCPNCKREFYAQVKGEYCPECWKAWCRNDGTFEQMEKLWPWQAERKRKLTCEETP
jgi:hypothetical protein